MAAGNTWLDKAVLNDNWDYWGPPGRRPKRRGHLIESDQVIRRYMNATGFNQSEK